MRSRHGTTASLCVAIVICVSGCCLPDGPGGYYVFGSLASGTGESTVDVLGVYVDPGNGQWLELPDLPFGNGVTAPDGSALGSGGFARSIVTDQGTACIVDQGIWSITGETLFSDLTEIPPEPARVRLIVQLSPGDTRELVVEIPQSRRILVGKMYELNLGPIVVQDE